MIIDTEFFPTGLIAPITLVNDQGSKIEIHSGLQKFNKKYSLTIMAYHNDTKSTPQAMVNLDRATYEHKIAYHLGVAVFNGYRILKENQIVRAIEEAVARLDREDAWPEHDEEPEFVSLPNGHQVILQCRPTDGVKTAYLTLEGDPHVVALDVAGLQVGHALHYHSE